MRVHHIAYAVSKIEDAADAFRALGFQLDSDAMDDESRNVRIAFMSNVDGVCIELVEPLNDKSPVTAQLADSHGASVPYHICYEVEDIKDAVSLLMRVGMVPVSGSSPAPAIEGRNVCFMYGGASGLIELVEAKSNE